MGKSNLELFLLLFQMLKFVFIYIYIYILGPLSIINLHVSFKKIHIKIDKTQLSLIWINVIEIEACTAEMKIEIYSKCN